MQPPRAPARDRIAALRRFGIAIAFVLTLPRTAAAWEVDPAKLEARIEQVAALLAAPAEQRAKILRDEGAGARAPSWIKETYWTMSPSPERTFALGVGTAKGRGSVELNFALGTQIASSQIARHLGKMTKIETPSEEGPQTTFRARAIVPSEVVDWYLPKDAPDTIYVLVAHERRRALDPQEIDEGVTD